ncbi:MAG: AAA domain-containing protein, partial [Flammeovirgaceae bacterium]|nr:AAA domain-containing protein [Flammeovirgaceae bacterium]
MMDYFEKLSWLLEQERAEQWNDYEAIVAGWSLAKRREGGYTWYPVKVKDREVTIGGKWMLTLARTTSDNKPHLFQVGSAVALFAQKESNKRETLKGVVAFLSKELMKVHLSCEELPDWLDEHPLGVDILPDDTTFSEMKNAIETLQKARENRLAVLRDVLIGKKSPEKTEEQVFYENPLLNSSQNDAIAGALMAKDVFIIHGPPGTGKTTTLIALIERLLAHERQLLVAAPSNTAVDVLTERLAQKSVQVVRLGHPARVDETLQRYTIDFLLSEHPNAKQIKKLRKQASELQRMAWQYKRTFGKEELEQRRSLLQEARWVLQEARAQEDHLLEQILESAQVITATLVGTNHPYLKHKRFSTVIVDEAAQALEPSCWIPILKAERIILAGDHCQLPPTVKNVVAAREGLAQSLFEKLIQQYPDFSCLLNVQYRMNEQIMEFSSQQFYHHQLQAHHTVRNHQISVQPIHRQETWNAPLLFIDTAGCGFNEQAEKEGTSKRNEEEARLLMKILTAWLATIADFVDIGQLSMGIISPYQAQVQFLEELAAQEPRFSLIEKLHIHTVDGFQGQERDVVAISLVRSNQEGEIGFLQDVRRMNVAMT